MNSNTFSKTQLIITSSIIILVMSVGGFFYANSESLFQQDTTSSSSSDNNTDSDNNSSTLQTEIDTLSQDIFDPSVTDPSDIISISEELLDSTGLSEQEIKDMLYIREEEKLARDVYLELYNQTNISAFNNIASSEQSHTDAMKQLLQNFGIPDPVVSDEIGIFTNSELANLYNTLIAQGSTSDIDALMVGATIEDLDIVDIQNAKQKTQNNSILSVYDNLERGSRNHLRSFTSLISSRGGSYLPQYLSQTEFDAIITSDRETGGNSGNGGKGRKQ